MLQKKIDIARETKPGKVRRIQTPPIKITRNMKDFLRGGFYGPPLEIGLTPAFQLNVSQFANPSGNAREAMTREPHLWTRSKPLLYA